MNPETASIDLESPIGRLRIECNEQALLAIHFDPPGRVDTSSQTAAAAIARQAAAQLEEYFTGRRRTFDLPLALRGTRFQQRVWQALGEIPFGSTWSYGDLARRIGSPGAARAVGAANGSNPLPVVVPCHRVIGADGQLTGYGGGIERKQWLLRHEGVLCPLFAPPTDRRR